MSRYHPFDEQIFQGTNFHVDSPNKSSRKRESMGSPSHEKTKKANFQYKNSPNSLISPVEKAMHHQEIGLSGNLKKKYL